MKTKNLVKQGFPGQQRIRIIPRVEKQEHEDSGHEECRNGCAACIEGRGVGGQHRIELSEEEERETTTPIVAFGYCFMTQENADTFPILICRNSRYGQTGATCCERKGPTAYSIFISCRFHQRSWFSQIHFEGDNEPSTKSLQDAVIQAHVGVEVIPPLPPVPPLPFPLRVITWPTVVWKWLCEK